MIKEIPRIVRYNGRIYIWSEIFKCFQSMADRGGILTITKNFYTEHENEFIGIEEKID